MLLKHTHNAIYIYIPILVFWFVSQPFFFLSQTLVRHPSTSLSCQLTGVINVSSPSGLLSVKQKAVDASVMCVMCVVVEGWRLLSTHIWNVRYGQDGHFHPPLFFSFPHHNLTPHLTACHLYSRSDESYLVISIPV